MKDSSKETEDSISVHSFQCVLNSLANINEVVFSFKCKENKTILTDNKRPMLNALQQKAMKLLSNIPKYGDVSR
ncbi:MAG: hypothetical protein LBS34_00030 [Rickettsiales bacterium]|nr:hypothetical protein [Rickettsiales bacterium]